MKISEESARKIPHSCIVKLQAIYNSLKSAERKAADFLLEDPEFVGKSTISEVAERAGCSEATLVRLSRKLGFGGYPELKRGLSQESCLTAENLYNGINVKDKPEDIIRKVFQSSIQALQDTLNVIDIREYMRAVEAICSSKKVVFFGVGDAGTVAESGFHKFKRVGYDCWATSDADMQLMLSCQLKKNDVAILISHSGRSKSIVNAAKQVRSSGATSICITNYPLSPLVKNSDILLLTAAFAEHLNGEVMSKRIAELCIIESLFISTLLNKGEILLNTMEKSNMAVEINKL